MGRDPETRPAARTARRATAAAALTYVVAAGVENMEVLGAPGFGASADAIRAAYADTALATVTWLAGALSLLAYAAFARGLQRLAPRRLAFAGAAAGVLLAAAGLAAAGVLVAPGGTDRPDETVRALHELQLALRLLAGPAMALFLAAAGLTAARAGVLRTWQGGLAAGCAVPLALTPIAAVTQSPVLVVAAFVAFGLHALWIWLAGLQLAVALDVRRSAFLMLVLAAGLVGLALLVVPGATSKFFAWELAPEGLAAFAGGVYIGSAVVYGVALAAGDRAVRGLVAGAVVLSVSVLVITLAHRAVFDFDRLQAWAWVVLFAGFGSTTTVLLVRGAGTGPRAADPLAPFARAVLALAGLALGVAGVALWLDPAGAGLPPLGGRFAGSWTAMLAVLALWAAVRDHAAEARLPALALVALPAGALLGAVRTGSGDAAYLAALVLLTVAGATVTAQTRPARRRAGVATATWHGLPGTPAQE